MNSLSPKTYEEGKSRAARYQARRRERQCESPSSKLKTAPASREGSKTTSLRRTGRLKARVDRKLVEWSKKVRERDGNQCQARKFSEMGVYEFTVLSCSGPLDAHHIAERSLRPDLKYDLKNGVVLCRQHHSWIPLNRAEATRIGLLNGETYEVARKAI